MWPFSNILFPALSPKDVGSKVPLSAESEGKGVYDFIIVGGGTAGCALAGRLSEDSSVRVLLVERGAPHSGWNSRVPLLSANLGSPDSPSIKINSAPLKDIDDRVFTMLTAKALGGASRLNGLIYTRGVPAEFDRWGQMGRKIWSYDKIKPYFIKSEGTLISPTPEHRGKTGPWVTRPVTHYEFASTIKCAEAIDSLGFKLVDDINLPTVAPAVCAKMDATIDARSYRCSTFDAYLPSELAIKRKGRLHVCTNTIVSSVDIQPGEDGHQRAVGIYFESHDSEKYYARARKEIVICCGAINSPKLLMLSGVGPKDELAKHDIALKKDLPGVGRNLQDHFGASTMYTIALRDSFYVLRKSLLRVVIEFFRYLFWGTGLFLLPITPISLFVRSSLLKSDFTVNPLEASQLDVTSPEGIPDLEIMPMAYNTTDDEIDISDGIFSFLSILLQPRSTGTISLASADPWANAICDLGFLRDPTDYEVLRKGVRLSRRIAERMQKNGYRITEFLVPKSDSDEDVDTFIRKAGRTTFHYAGTCRMAPEDDARPGVVDDELRVYGVKGLRVADCSVFPDVLATHLQAAAVMVAEKCADMMKDTAGLKTY